MTTVAVTIGVRDEERNISALLDALLDQSMVPDEIVVVDDGSVDDTPEVAADYANRDPRIRCLKQANAGPAAARNKAWRSATSTLCLFTDGDCVPDRDWVERLVAPFANPEVGASAGTYRTLNPDRLLARLVGDEIDWRYRNVKDFVDCHGTYNLAVRHSILEKIGGFDESYRFPSGEDFDLTYKISSCSRIAFVRDAVVGHHHPHKLLWYWRNQIQRARDRVRLYATNPEKTSSDSYTSWLEKYQVLAAGLSIPSVLLIGGRIPFGHLIPAALLVFLLVTSMAPFPWLWQRSPRVALFSVPVRFMRNYAWLLGVVRGLLSFETLRLMRQR